MRFVVLLTAFFIGACSGRGGSSPSPSEPDPQAEAAAAEARRVQQERARIDAEYPLHGLLTAAQVPIRSAPNPEADVVGWVRLGARVRLGTERIQTSTCRTGWYAIHPRGHVCAGQGVEVSESASEDVALAADVGRALPYRYFFVSEPQVPEYHQLPSRTVQRAAAAHGARYAELLNAGQERRARRLREQGIPGEPARPPGVARYLQRGFYVAAAGIETRADRRFVRTVRGTYVKLARLNETAGSEFAGVSLSEDAQLPIAWAIRESAPRRRVIRQGETESRFVLDTQMAPWERLTRIPWLRRENIDDELLHVLAGPGGEERFLRAWFVAVAEAIERPASIGEEEAWVHVDLSEQTLVAYRGDVPVYATLVSTGVDGHDTPVGLHRIRRKLVSDTMANLGPEAGDDAYRIEDVPWTQYFQGSFALHGAFWHRRFGLRRSHGCVNLAPADARWVFEHTHPSIPDGWHGVRRRDAASDAATAAAVLITE